MSVARAEASEAGDDKPHIGHAIEARNYAVLARCKEAIQKLRHEFRHCKQEGGWKFHAIFNTVHN